jgi:hypothetical protein
MLQPQIHTLLFISAKSARLKLLPFPPIKRIYRYIYNLIYNKDILKVMNATTKAH